MAWRILERPSDTVLPDDVRGRLEALNDYRHHEWKAVAMWALTHSFRNLGDPEVSFFAQRGSHSARDGGRTADPLGSHDRQRLGEILCALEQVAGVDMLNRRSAIDRRGHTAAAIRDLDKGFPVRLVRGLSVSAADRAGALIRLHGELQKYLIWCVCCWFGPTSSVPGLAFRARVRWRSYRSCLWISRRRRRSLPGRRTCMTIGCIVWAIWC